MAVCDSNIQVWWEKKTKARTEYYLIKTIESSLRDLMVLFVNEC